MIKGDQLDESYDQNESWRCHLSFTPLGLSFFLVQTRVLTESPSHSHLTHWESAWGLSLSLFWPISHALGHWPSTGTRVIAKDPEYRFFFFTFNFYGWSVFKRSKLSNNSIFFFACKTRFHSAPHSNYRLSKNHVYKIRKKTRGSRENSTLAWMKENSRSIFEHVQTIN